MPRVLVELTGSYVRRVVYAVLLLGGVSGGWWIFTPGGRPIYVHPTTNLAIKAACDKVLKELPTPQVGLDDVLILPFTNDRKVENGRELVAEALRETIAHHGGYKVVDMSRTDRFRLWIAEQANLTWLKSNPVIDKDHAIRFADWAEADFVMTGQILKLEQPNEQSPDRHAVVQFNLQLFEFHSQTCLWEKTFDNGPGDKPESPVDKLVTAPTYKWYGPAVLLFATVWPLSLTAMMRRVLRMENNQVTLFTLLSIIAVPVALAWPWAFGASAGVWRTIFFVIGAVVIALWCSFVMSRVAEMNKY